MNSQPPVQVRTNPIFSANRLKLGTFGTNGRAGPITTAPDAHQATWESNLRAASIADRAGLEVLLAFARWKNSLPGVAQDHPANVTLDPFTWAAGLAQATNYSAILPTTHANTIHPIVAAKQTATLDAISGGRSGLNVVAGWNETEFKMFGLAVAERDNRYDYLEEWLEVLERLWSEPAEFDYAGSIFHVTGALSMPQPIQKPRPAIMNAGGSERGRRFACEHADICFVPVKSDNRAVVRAEVEGYKSLARETFGREVSVWTGANVVQRDTRGEAEAYLDYFAVKHEDTPMVDEWARVLINAEYTDPADIAAIRLRIAAASGGALLVGTAREIADGLEEFAEMGMDGVLLTFNDYTDGLARLVAGVLPELERRGLREPFTMPANRV